MCPLTCTSWQVCSRVLVLVKVCSTCWATEARSYTKIDQLPQPLTLQIFNFFRTVLTMEHLCQNGRQLQCNTHTRLWKVGDQGKQNQVIVFTSLIKENGRKQLLIRIFLYKQLAVFTLAEEALVRYWALFSQSSSVFRPPWSVRSSKLSQPFRNAWHTSVLSFKKKRKGAGVQILSFCHACMHKLLSIEVTHTHTLTSWLKLLKKEFFINTTVFFN